MLNFLTENAGEVVENTLTAAEKVNEFFAKPGVQAAAWILGAVAIIGAVYQFVVKPGIRKLKKR